MLREAALLILVNYFCCFLIFMWYKDHLPRPDPLRFFLKVNRWQQGSSSTSSASPSEVQGFTGTCRIQSFWAQVDLCRLKTWCFLLHVGAIFILLRKSLFSVCCLQAHSKQGMQVIFELSVLVMLNHIPL